MPKHVSEQKERSAWLRKIEVGSDEIIVKKSINPPICYQ